MPGQGIVMGPYVFKCAYCPATKRRKTLPEKVEHKFDIVKPIE